MIQQPRYHPTSFGGASLLCSAYTRMGLPCGLNAVANTNPPRCFHHGARNQNLARRITNGNSRMPRWYKKHVGPKLADVIDEHLQATVDEQTAVFEEIALMRESAGQFVAIFSKLVEVDAPAEAKATAALAMNEALKDVVDVCTKATKAHEKIKSFSTLDIQNICAQLTSILWETCGTEHMDIAKRFVALMEERLVLPTNNVQATDLKIEDTAREMDSTIPLVSEDEDDASNLD